MSSKEYFLISQIVLLIFFIFFFLKKGKSRQDLSYGKSEEIFKSKQVPLSPGNSKNQKPESISSAFPSWTDQTAPHIVLGIPEDSKASTIEMAHKILLKKFHPDKYASWGGDYQEKAHEAILRIQKAKEEMLKKLA